MSEVSEVPSFYLTGSGSVAGLSLDEVVSAGYILLRSHPPIRDR